jgi:hypothetical protein
MRRGLKHADHASGPAAANCAKRPKPGANDNEILLPLPLASYWWRNSPTTPPKAISFSTGHAANVPPDWSTKKWANRAATLQQGADVFRLGGSAHLDFYLTGSLRFLSATQPPIFCAAAVSHGRCFAFRAFQPIWVFVACRAHERQEDAKARK